MMQDQFPPPAVLIDIYRRMSLIKQNDERFLSTIKAGRIVAPYYSPRGQEAIPSAVSVSLTNEDYICTIYRGFHDMLAKGIPLKQLWAEVAGRATGTCKGKGGPMHITHPATGVMVTTDGYILTNNHVVADFDLVTVLAPDARLFVGKVSTTTPAGFAESLTS